jgi:hypothetical protein
LDALAASRVIRWRSKQRACARRHENGYVVARVVVPWSCRSKIARRERNRGGSGKGSCSTRTEVYIEDAQALRTHTSLEKYSPSSSVLRFAASRFVASSSAVATVARRALRLASPALHSTANRPMAGVAGASASDPPERSLAPSTLWRSASPSHLCRDNDAQYNLARITLSLCMGMIVCST